MNLFLRNSISKLYNTVSPVAPIRDALAERLQTVHETTSLLYNRMMENMEYGREVMGGDIVEKQQQKPTATKEEEAKEQQQEPAAGKEQQQDDDERYDTVEIRL